MGVHRTEYTGGTLRDHLGLRPHRSTAAGHDGTAGRTEKEAS
jgi:hypothetical protein